MPRVLPLLAAALLLAPLATGATLETGPTIVMRAAAVSESSRGFVGSTATISITSATNGSGHVFLDTFPLTNVDMQGSARLAARVAAQLSGVDRHERDFFFVVRSGSQQIGGPSAGASMAVGAIAALNGWNVRDDAAMTGTINPDGTVGPVGGIAEKAAASARVGITRFLFPSGQEIVPLGERIVNMTPYCRDELKIECVPVSDVLEAVALMTDHVIERPAVNGNVTGEAFLARLAPLGVELVDEAAAIVGEADAALDAAPASVTKTALEERLRTAEGTLQRARSAVAEQTYYTAASLSFQTSIDAHYVREASEYLAATDKAGAVAATLSESDAVIRSALAKIETSPVRDTNTFEAVGAAQVRIMEAEERQGMASTLARAPRSTQDLLDAIYHASYAAERAETAAWWLKLAEGFPEGEPVERDALEEIARDTITTSTEEVAYVEAVFESSSGMGELPPIREILADADEAMARGFVAGAMLHALEASVRASVILEIAGFGGQVPQSKFETARENAARAIQGARARGVESILAQSAYEFGLSLEEPRERLAFLGLARVTGNLAGLPGLFDERSAPPETRFQGIPAPYRVEVVYVAAAFAVGIALGVGAGLTAMMPRRPEDDLGTATGEPPASAVPRTNDGR